jgi:phytoene desaturase
MGTRSAIIIGAGIGGLACAIRLRLHGYDVLVLEKNDRVGGKMYLHEADGFRWDTGPSVVTMRHVFEALFHDAGRHMEDYLTLLPLDPLTRYFYPDGTVFDASPSTSQMAANVAALDERDVEGYFAFLAYAARIHRVTGPVFIYDKPPTPASFARVPVTEWLAADPFRTMQQAINHHVRSPHLRQLLGRFATYVGGSPFAAPATLNVIAHVELMGGVWYPQGGIYQIAAAFARLARELGVTIQTGTPIQQIIVENGRATGVVTAAGDRCAADVIVSNLDVTTTVERLLPPEAVPQRQRQRLVTYAPSCSGFILMLGVKRRFPQLAHHNLFFSEDYRAEFRAIFDDLVPAPRPSIYVSITAKTDPDHAPPDSENWFVLINAPARAPHVDWQAQARPYADRVLDLLAERGFDVRPHLAHETIWTPADLEANTGAWRGALYGPSANSRFTAFLRPHNRSRAVQGLYFVGGTTHPGGGVPMVTLSGKVAADCIVEDQR